MASTAGTTVTVAAFCHRRSTIILFRHKSIFSRTRTTNVKSETLRYNHQTTNPTRNMERSKQPCKFLQDHFQPAYRSPDIMP